MFRSLSAALSVLSIYMLVAGCQSKNPSQVEALSELESQAMSAPVPPALSALNQNPEYKISSSELESLKQQGLISDAEIAELEQALKL